MSTSRASLASADGSCQLSFDEPGSSFLPETATDDSPTKFKSELNNEPNSPFLTETTTESHLAENNRPDSSLLQEVATDDNLVKSISEPASLLWQETAQETATDSPETEPDLKSAVFFAQGRWKWAWHLLALTLASSCTTGGISLLALATLISLPPEVDCSNLDQGVSDRATLTCLQEEIAVGKPDAILNALNWVGRWEYSHPLYNEAQELLEAWSNTVLNTAQQYQEIGRIPDAIALVSYIPPASPRYYDAYTLLRQLRTAHKETAAAIYEEAQTLLKQQSWTLASQALVRLQALENEVSDTGFARILAQRIEAEQRAQKLLDQAIQKRALGRPQQYGEAIAIASQIDPGTYVWQSSQPLLKTWSDELLLIGSHRMEQGNFEGAVALVRQIARNPNRRGMAQDWLVLAQARQLAQASVRNSTNHLAPKVGLYPAILAAQSIQPESPWWSRATAYSQRWKTHLELAKKKV